MQGLQKQFDDDITTLKIPLIADQNQNQNQWCIERSQTNSAPPAAETIDNSNLENTAAQDIANSNAHAIVNDEEKLNFSRTCLNVLNSLSGVGLLSVPYALASGGWLSLGLLFLIASITYYTGFLIKNCVDRKPSLRTYPDIGQEAFGRKGKLLVSLTIYAELYLIPIGFLILEGDNLNRLFPHAEVHLGRLMVGGMKLFVVGVALVILPTMWLGNLKLLSYVSTIGVCAPFIIIIAMSCTGVGFHQRGTLINWKGVPNAVSLYAFCYGAHPLFPPMYNNMRNKRQFANVLLVCFSFATIGYASIAIVGYLMFGSLVESQVTLNLPLAKLSSKVAIYCALVNPIAKYALLTTPITDAVKDLLPNGYNNRATSILISTLLLITMVVVAVTVPFFGSLMALVGAFLNVSASILIPCICYIKISGIYKTINREMIQVSGIIIVGLAIGMFGTFTSIGEIVQQYL